MKIRYHNYKNSLNFATYQNEFDKIYNYNKYPQQQSQQQQQQQQQHQHTPQRTLQQNTNSISFLFNNGILNNNNNNHSNQNNHNNNTINSYNNNIKNSNDRYTIAQIQRRYLELEADDAHCHTIGCNDAILKNRYGIPNVTGVNNASNGKRPYKRKNIPTTAVIIEEESDEDDLDEDDDDYDDDEDIEEMFGVSKSTLHQKTRKQSNSGTTSPINSNKHSTPKLSSVASSPATSSANNPNNQNNSNQNNNNSNNNNSNSNNNQNNQSNGTKSDKDGIGSYAAYFNTTPSAKRGPGRPRKNQDPDQPLSNYLKKKLEMSQQQQQNTMNQSTNGQFTKKRKQVESPLLLSSSVDGGKFKKSESDDSIGSVELSDTDPQQGHSKRTRTRKLVNLEDYSYQLDDSDESDVDMDEDFNPSNEGDTKKKRRGPYKKRAQTKLLSSPLQSQHQTPSTPISTTPLSTPILSNAPLSPQPLSNSTSSTNTTSTTNTTTTTTINTTVNSDNITHPSPPLLPPPLAVATTPKQTNGLHQSTDSLQTPPTKVDRRLKRNQNNTSSSDVTNGDSSKVSHSPIGSPVLLSPATTSSHSLNTSTNGLGSAEHLMVSPIASEPPKKRGPGRPRKIQPTLPAQPLNQVSQ